MLTGTGLAEFALARCGTPYFYGAKITHGALTEQFMEKIHRRFPRIADEEYLQKARDKGQVGKVNVDCSGLIGAYRGRERSTAQLYATARLRMDVSGIRDFPVGTVLWKEGHVGIYVGIREEVPVCVEAKGIDHGTVLTNAADTDWQAGLTFSDLGYGWDRELPGRRRRKNPFPLPDAAWEAGSGSRGEAVRWLQWELREAGYSLAVDGIFGEETERRLTAFQTSCEMEPDGIAGREERDGLSIIL